MAKVGDRWRTRDGSIATVMQILEGDPLRFVAMVKDKNGPPFHYSERNLNVFHSAGHDYDLISKLSEEPPAPKEKVDVWRKENTSFPWNGWIHERIDPDNQPQQDQSGSGGGNQSGKGNGQGPGGGGGSDKEEQTGNYTPRQTSANNVRTEYAKGGMIKVYDSFDAYIDHADDIMRSRMAWGDCGRASRDNDNPEWSGSKTFEEAIEQARFGWKYGMTHIDQIVEEYNRKTRWTVDRALTLDVAGMYPDVPECLSGNPANMIDGGDDRKKVKPLVHIIVNRSANWTIPKKHIMNFGAALMVCIDQIEMCGVRVELEAVNPVSDRGDPAFFLTRIMVKKAHEHIEKNRLAFAMAHPGFLRRLKFSIMEQTRELRGYRNGYGQPVEMEEELIPTNAVYVRSLQCFGNWDTIESSVQELQKLFGLEAVDGGRIEFNFTKDKEAA